MKPSTFAKVRHVHDTAQDATAPEPVRAVAQEQMAALDKGDTNPRALSAASTAPSSVVGTRGRASRCPPSPR